MDARLSQTAFSQRDAAAQTVANSLAPRSTGSTAKSAATAAATGTGSSTSSSTAAASTSDITSSDFLTLLVNELKNQDPTQPTDPNEYITQLAQVNSLEQLIQINSGISTLDSAVTPTTTSGSTTGGSATGGSTTGGSTTGIATTGASAGATSPAADLQPATASPATSQLHRQTPGAGAL